MATYSDLGERKTMNHYLHRAILALAFVALGIQGHAETPRRFAERFYRAYFRWQIRGVPSAVERRLIAPYFSSKILRLYAATDQQSAEFDRLFPLDPKHPENALKPPWSKEGDPFSDSWEGISTFAVGRVIRVRGHVAVQVHLNYLKNGKSVPWTDTLVLDHAADHWVIADILFVRGGALIADMQNGIADTSRDLREARKRNDYSRP
jgi:hypothetical protein